MHLPFFLNKQEWGKIDDSRIQFKHQNDPERPRNIQNYAEPTEVSHPKQSRITQKLPK